MKVKDIPVLKQKVLDMLPVMQSDMWKNLGISHRDGSALVSIMIEEHLVKKTRRDGTFLLERINGDGNIQKKKDFSVLLSKSGKFAPCIGCILECVPSKCTLLYIWLLE